MSRRTTEVVRAIAVDDKLEPARDDRRNLEAGSNQWLPDAAIRTNRFESAIADLLTSMPADLGTADRITVVPDAHYPFHPSSGVVTDPAVVAATVSVLSRQTGADLAVAGRSDDTIEFDRAANALGYPSVLEVDLVDLEDERETSVAVDLEEETTTLSVPKRLVSTPTVVVPSLRPTQAGPVAGPTRTLARFVDGPENPATTTLAATRAVDPALTVLDATTAYGKTPVVTDTLFSGPTRAVDVVASSLLERSLEDDPALKRAFDGDASVSVTTVGDREVDLEAIRDRLEGGSLPPADDTHPILTLGYRLYAAVSGDVVPPQLEGALR